MHKARQHKTKTKKLKEGKCEPKDFTSNQDVSQVSGLQKKF